MNSTIENNDIIYEYFLSEPYKKLKVADNYYDCVLGTKTTGSFYVNGYRAKNIIGKKEKWGYIQVDFYTSVGNTIDIEERLLIRNDGKICRRTGWNNIDLLKYERPGESYNVFKNYVNRQLN